MKPYTQLHYWRPKKTRRTLNYLALIGGFAVNGQSGIENDEKTLWLKYTTWPVSLAGRPLDILSASALRRADDGGDNILGS